MNLSELIRRELARSREPDPHVVGRRLLPKLTEEMRQEILVQGIAELVRREIRLARMDKSVGVPGPSRRSIVMRERVCVRGDWMMLEECGVDDLLAIADEYRTRSKQLAAKALEFDGLAHELKRSGCATVGEMRARTKQREAA